MLKGIKREKQVKQHQIRAMRSLCGDGIKEPRYSRPVYSGRPAKGPEFRYNSPSYVLGKVKITKH